MLMPNLVILYVDDPVASSEFYQRLLGKAPDDCFPTWAAFSFDNGLHLGLWSKQARDFVSDGSGHRSELSFMVESPEKVEALYQQWLSLGVDIEQAPLDAVFGRTFVARDPDGHRLRVCVPDN
ncbi:VOC family protein [Nissabacter sp. SGAir0207]|uniref:VOC family protein n=1 Tax=Nissabacter sp. SGAir0207 TaxID=2126321 RepID=UPI0010CD43B5|nr:VOC family protein [Nissabacter sp. SGAir0207]QCR37988.1 glyoxalase [Nissabacter sp. SGAir0207]